MSTFERFALPEKKKAAPRKKVAAAKKKAVPAKKVATAAARKTPKVVQTAAVRARGGKAK